MTTIGEGLEPTSGPVVLKSEITKSPDFCAIYSNWVQTGYSAHEISLLIGQSFQKDAEILEVDLKARVVFGPLEAKLVFYILGKMIKGYESQFEEIKIPEVVLRNMASQLPEFQEMLDAREKSEGD
jgi:hypothetical protein